MKANLIVAALACMATTVHAKGGSLYYRYNDAADPCFEMQRKECKETDFCVWTEEPRNAFRGRKDAPTYGHHSGPAGRGGSCAMLHAIDRRDQNDLPEGFHKELLDMECHEAFFLKDCKDINQANALAGTHDAKCRWTCDNECEGNDGSVERLWPQTKDCWPAFDPANPCALCTAVLWLNDPPEGPKPPFSEGDYALSLADHGATCEYSNGACWSTSCGDFDKCIDEVGGFPWVGDPCGIPTTEGNANGAFHCDGQTEIDWTAPYTEDIF